MAIWNNLAQKSVTGVTRALLRLNRSEGAMISMALSGNGGSIVRSALARGGVGAGVGAAYGGATNPDGNYLGGAASGALKMGALGALGVGGGLAGYRMYATRFGAGRVATKRMIKNQMNSNARTIFTKSFAAQRAYDKFRGGLGKSMWN